MKSLLLIFISILSLSCSKEDITSSITDNKWKVKSVIVDNQKETAPVFTWAYVLEFDSDTTFLMNTSVNTGGGNIKIISEDLLEIKYCEFTEVGGHNDFDELLLAALSPFSSIMNYELKGNKLALTKYNKEVVLKKK